MYLKSCCLFKISFSSRAGILYFSFQKFKGTMQPTLMPDYCNNIRHTVGLESINELIFVRRVSIKKVLKRPQGHYSTDGLPLCGIAKFYSRVLKAGIWSPLNPSLFCGVILNGCIMLLI